MLTSQPSSGQIPFCGSSLLQLQGIIHLTTVGKALWVFCHLDPEKTLVASHFPWTRAGHMSSPSCRKPGNCAGACGVSDPFADERSETQRGRWEGTKLVMYRSVAELGWKSSLPSRCAHSPRGGWRRLRRALAARGRRGLKMAQ